MKTQITFISVFVFLNLAIGRLFQESLSVTCFSELLVISATSFVFWSVFAKQLKHRKIHRDLFKSPVNFIKHCGYGLGATMANVLLGYGLIVSLMVFVYQCTSPSFDLVNASLTNNIAINLACYFVLVFSSLQQQEEETSETKQVNHSNKSLSFTTGTTTKMIPVNAIEFIETSNNCIIVNTSEGKFVKYQSLKTFLEDVNIPSFKRVHKSFAVNIDFVDSVKKNKNGDGIITLKDNSTVRMSRNFALS